MAANNVAIQFLNHAEERIAERGLDRELIVSLCEGAAPMLKVGKGLRFKVAGQTIVAQKKSGNVVQVITAWAQKKR